MRRRIAADRRHRGGGLRRRLARAEGLQRRRHPGARATRPSCAASAFPAIPTTRHSRYIEAEVGGLIVGSLYLPNGNPVGTEKFDYKLRWMERLRAHAAELLEEERPAVLCGDWNVVPEDRDVFSVRATPARRGDAARSAPALAPDRQPGLDRRAARAPPERRRSSTPSGTIPPAAGSATSASASTICSARPRRPTGCSGAGVDKWARGEEKASRPRADLGRTRLIISSAGVQHRRVLVQHVLPSAAAQLVQRGRPHRARHLDSAAGRVLLRPIDQHRRLRARAGGR